MFDLLTSQDFWLMNGFLLLICSVVFVIVLFAWEFVSNLQDRKTVRLKRYSHVFDMASDFCELSGTPESRLSFNLRDQVLKMPDRDGMAMRRTVIVYSIEFDGQPTFGCATQLTKTARHIKDMGVSL